MAGMKRCKNCVLWVPYKGDEPTLPRARSHACMLRLAEVEQGGEKVLRPTMREMVRNAAGESVETKPGPYYRKRVGPNSTCAHFVGKRPPLLKAKPVRESLPPMTVNVVDTDSELPEDVSKQDTDLAGDDRSHRTNPAA